jgi:hypothetical protein
MAPNSQASSAVTDPGSSGTRRSSAAIPRYGIVVVALVSWFGIRPLRFSFPEVADWLPALYLACLLVLFFFFLGDLLFRRWKEVAIFVAIRAADS